MTAPHHPFVIPESGLAAQDSLHHLADWLAQHVPDHASPGADPVSLAVYLLEAACDQEALPRGPVGRDEPQPSYAAQEGDVIAAEALIPPEDLAPLQRAVDEAVARREQAQRLGVLPVTRYTGLRPTDRLVPLPSWLEVARPVEDRRTTQAMPQDDEPQPPAHLSRAGEVRAVIQVLEKGQAIREQYDRDRAALDGSFLKAIQAAFPDAG